MTKRYIAECQIQRQTSTKFKNTIFDLIVADNLSWFFSKKFNEVWKAEINYDPWWDDEKR